MRVSVLAVAGLVALAACSSGDNPDGLFGNGGSIDGTGSGAGGPIDATSLQYFNQVIGDRVFFAVDQSNLTPEAIETLNKQADWLMQNPGSPVTIEGHSDEQGTREYNIALSARRAAAVRDYLVSRGIPDARLSTAPYGKERPVSLCDNESCWSLNRRAVTVVAGATGV
jgi:peptidoglycan-associated lipoprotein